MARKKVNLQLIANDSTRRATFKKRRRGLLKKASELATLCDVRACVVVYSPDEAQPEVWPSLPEATRVLSRFKAMPELEQCKKMMNQEGFLRQRVSKLQEQLRKQERENRELETTFVMHEAIAGRRPGLTTVGIEQVASLGWMVQVRLKSVQDRIGQLRAQALAAPPPTLPLPLPSPPPLPLPAPPASGPQQVAQPDAVNVEAPEAPLEAATRQSWLMEVLNAGNVGGGTFFNGFGGGPSNGCGVGTVDDMIQLYMDSGFAWPDPSALPHI